MYVTACERKTTNKKQIRIFPGKFKFVKKKMKMSRGKEKQLSTSKTQFDDENVEFV